MGRPDFKLAGPVVSVPGSQPGRAQESRRITIERNGDPAKIEERHVALTALDFPHVRTIKASQVRQGLLRHTKIAPPRADGLSYPLKSTIGVLLARYPGHTETSPCDAYMATVFTTHLMPLQGRKMLAPAPPVPPPDPKQQAPKSKPPAMPTSQRMRPVLTIMVPVVAFVLGLTARDWMGNQYDWNRDRASAVLDKVDPICAQTGEAARAGLIAREADRDQPWIAVICAAYDEGRRAR